MRQTYLGLDDVAVAKAVANQSTSPSGNEESRQFISDITGVSGLRIIRSILAGERDPMVLAAMKDHRIKSTPERIAQSLHGDYRPEHLFALQQCLSLYDTYRQMIADCDQQIDRCLGSFDAKIDPSENRSVHTRPPTESPSVTRPPSTYEPTSTESRASTSPPSPDSTLSPCRPFSPRSG